ncbi:MAG: helix-turn-helix transcriptional regulator, partial [Actinomycetota bacterium]|nr:helix-turn-helix transcriptional regulator [Actinomycetota bacterium]
ALGRAYEELSAQGAGRYRDQAAAALRALGGGAMAAARAGGRGAGSEGLGALSERQGEIAALVAEGYTSPEIADQLRLTPKTVANHLTRIYRRLRLSSRQELAALIERSRQP